MHDKTQKAIGMKLNQLRRERKLTLEQLSEITGVSKSMLSAIERGQKSPTLTVLTKINDGLHVSLTELIGDQNQQSQRLITRAEMKHIAYKRGCDLIMMLEYSPETRFEIMNQVIAPQTCWRSKAQIGGNIWEYCIPVDGDLVMRVENQSHRVQKGEVFCFMSNVNHAYVNESDEPRNVILVISYK